MKDLEINGYFTIVETEILDFLPLLGLTKRELEFMIVMIRLNNGFHKNGDRIPLSQFFNLTRVNKSNGSRTLKKLIDKKMVLKDGEILAINRDFSQWKGVANLTTLKGLPKWIRKVVNSYNKKVASLGTSKETSKETIQIKVLSKSQREKKKKEYKTGLAMMKEAIKRHQEK
ncbi:unnamed protein product [marine sediment metagenome]|uniref:Bacteriophage lambda Replication protein O N-terminal domain-containing protein n=1 Tax=marine sediment metagenome TaxID=412755 RepID=X1PY03_9ZZZZ